MKLRTALVLSTAACLVFAVSPATAGKVTPSIALSSVSSSSTALSAATQPALGSLVTFTTVVPTNVKNPRVEVLCYQSGELVYGEAGAPTDTFLLGGNPDRGSIWRTTLGPASCVANLYYFTWKAGEPAVTYLATTSFNAA